MPPELYAAILNGYLPTGGHVAGPACCTAMTGPADLVVAYLCADHLLQQTARTDNAQAVVERVGAIIDSAATATRAGGYVVFVTAPWRTPADGLVDLPSAVAALCADEGLMPYERNVAVAAADLAGLLTPHYDVLAFRAPGP